MDDSFLDSRYDFLFYLSNQVSINTSESLYDKSGTLSRAVLLGIPKAKIEEFLNKNSIYQTNLELMKNTSLVTDPIEKAKLLDFKDFYDSLQALEDSDTKVSLRQEVADRISKYKDSEGALLALDEGEPPKEIFTALKQSEDWKQDARDFLSRSYVDLPSRSQRAGWIAFNETVELIKDLKHLN